MKSCLVITSLLIVCIPLSGAVDTPNDQTRELITSFEDGLWVNNSIEITGTTNLNPQLANWSLYDITNPHLDELPVVRSGDYFTSVLPISDGVWNWTLTIDVLGLNCSCWLEISQSDDEGTEFLNRTFFIGEGPHNPVILSTYSSNVVIDGSEIIYFKALFSDSQPNQSIVILDWCYAPNGACDGQIFSSQVNVSWSGDLGSFEINANKLNLSDGIWKFSYSVQDLFLRLSPKTDITVFIDQNNPISSLIAPEKAQEGETILIDGSGSSDGAWTNNLQAIWYITGPDGVTYVPNSNTTTELLYVTFNESGNHTIRLDVVDWVGRMSSNITTVIVENVVPSINLGIRGSDVNNPTSWQILVDEDLEIFSTIYDTGNDISTMTYSWYLDNEMVSSSANLSLDGLDVGEYKLRLYIEDDNGDGESYEMQINVISEQKSVDDEVNYGGIFVIIAIIVFSLFMFKRMKTKDFGLNSMPKWDDKTKKGSPELDNLEKEEGHFWD